MTAFSTHFSKNSTFDWLPRSIVLAILLFAVHSAHAQTAAELSQIRTERIDDEILVSAQVSFELPSAVEDALLKGIPMYFVAQADITKERWYWYDKKISVAERYMRLAHQPLTRKWRLNVTNGLDRSGPNGLALNQSFDTLPQAMAVIKRIFRWKVADTSDLDGSGKYRLELRFRLDLTQLPRPFQIGAIGQSEWDIGGMVSTTLALEPGK